jgi:hypothetical protein
VQGKLINFDTTIINARNEIRPIDLRLIPTPDDKGRVIYIIANARDIAGNIKGTTGSEEELEKQSVGQIDLPAG